MGSLFGVIMLPFSKGWALLESHVWASLIGVAALAVVTWMTGSYLTTCLLVCVAATLLMRVDALKAAVALPAAE